MARHGAIEKYKWHCARCKRLWTGFVMGGADVSTEERPGYEEKL